MGTPPLCHSGLDPESRFYVVPITSVDYIRDPETSSG
jgi:hypothetical protein